MPKLAYCRGEEIVKAGEPVDFLGILIQGSAFILIEHKNMKVLKLGDMIGHMVASDFTTKDVHLATIVASIDGIIAVLPFGELKAELRRAPEAVFKSFQMASKYSMETFFYNLNGHEHN